MERDKARHRKACSRSRALTIGLLASLTSACGTVQVDCGTVQVGCNTVQVFPEPWQVAEPGAPVGKPLAIEIVAEGAGEKIELGDLIQITKKFWSIETKEFINSDDWWLWIGFTSNGKAQSGDQNNIRSPLLGLAEGTSLKYLSAENHWGDTGRLHINPLGDDAFYSWMKRIDRKSVAKFSHIYVPSRTGYYPGAVGYWSVEIKRVCKGKLKYRTLHLYDDSWYRACFGGRPCNMINTPREEWVDEEKIEALCSDGKTAVFNYGPVTSRNGKLPRDPDPENYFTPWRRAAWDALPVGVQLKGYWYRWCWWC